MAIDAGELRPRIDLNSFKTSHLNMSNGRVYREVFGQEGWDYFKACARREDTAGFNPQAINNEFVARFGMYSGMPETTNQGVFYDHWVAQVDRGKEIISKAIKTIAPHREELLQPLSNPLYNPVDVIRLLGTPTAEPGDSFKGVSPELKHTAATVMLLANFSGELAVALPSNRFKVRAGDMTTHFENTLFQGRNEGETEKVKMYSDHDLRTNSLLQHGRDLGSLPIGSRRFEHVVKARKTQRGDQFFYEGGIKSADSAALKVLRYQLGRSGEVGEGADLTLNLPDYVRFRFVSLEKGSESLLNLKMDVLRSLFDFPGGIKDVQYRGATKGSLGSSDMSLERVYVRMPHFDGRKVELMFMTHDQLVDQYREVGDVDPWTGIRTGKAHSLYDIRRNAELATEVLFPQAVYGVSLVKDIMEASESAARKLETEGLVDQNGGFGLN